MSAKRKDSPRVGDRVRDKLTRRVGAVDTIQDVDGVQQYAVTYDEAPQDRYLTTPAKDGAQREEHLLEPETEG